MEGRYNYFIPLLQFCLIIMIAINSPPEERGFKVGAKDYANQIPTLPNATKHRNIFTAKLRPRTLVTSGKAIRPEPSGSSINYEQNTSNEDKEGKTSHKQEGSILNQFDNLQLEDFLKVVIVGKSKLSETKSKEIIRSLNGTWFRNTQSNHPISRLYCSLPIKKQKSATGYKKSEELMSKSNLGEHFYKNYTPPNLFPKRKSSPKICSSQLRIDHGQTSKELLDDEIKGQILKKFSTFRQSSSQSRSKRRSSSYFSNAKHSVIKFFQDDSGCLLGKKMVIHE